MSDIGHNSLDAERLKSFGQRIQNLNAERKELQDDIKEVYTEAKAAGYDTKILRHTIRELELDAADRAERDELRALYMRVFE